MKFEEYEGKASCSDRVFQEWRYQDCNRKATWKVTNDNGKEAILCGIHKAAAKKRYENRVRESKDLLQREADESALRERLDRLGEALGIRILKYFNSRTRKYNLSECVVNIEDLERIVEERKVGR